MTQSIPFNIPFLAVAALIGIALYIIMSKRNLIKLVMGIAILEAGVNLFLITLGYREAGVAPIYTSAPAEIMVLPVPQALTLTSIVIGVSILALMLSMIVHTYRHTGTLDSEASRKLKG
ncbi:MAG: cation:proton antiporter subunit C [Dehalococcoidia bacterium]|nr:cation:proton antiporter subunit C [Dehalococcoidia bacterium]